MPTATGAFIGADLTREVAFELNRRAAIHIPGDVRQSVRGMAERETERLSKFVLLEIVNNYEVADEDLRPMCADTGLPRFYAKVGNEARLEGGFVAFERSIREATARATTEIPLRPNRVHPITRNDYNNNVGIHAPSVDYSWEPGADWVEMTAFHKGGLFGGDYRMLFPGDGIDGIRRFYLDVISEFFKRGLSCQPAIVGIGIGGTKDTCVKLAKEAACLRVVGDRNPDPQIADLEDELVELGKRSTLGAMGFKGEGAVMDAHIEVAYTHTGGMPVSIHHQCFALRRSTARIHPDGEVEYREDPRWFTDYYRRDSVS
ncbi:MAG TPA: fumarate hydratase [Nitrospinota bacterium]|nr:fumarate hydratase [Nitrospinota bacterium]